MYKEVVGSVTEQEKNEMLVLFERKLGIDELALTLDSGLLSNEERKLMIDKMEVEMQKNEERMQNWWDTMYQKYQFKSAEGMSWNIDFQTCEIILFG